MSFIIVVRKNLAARRREIDLYRTLGFSDHKIEQMLYKENLLVPLYAIAAGIVSALVGVCMNFASTSVSVWLLALLFAVFFVAGVVVFVKKSVSREVQNSNLA
jgi:putative ABC transport system permease protein